MHHPSIRKDCCHWKRKHLLKEVLSILSLNLATDGASARPPKKTHFEAGSLLLPLGLWYDEGWKIQPKLLLYLAQKPLGPSCEDMVGDAFSVPHFVASITGIYPHIPEKQEGFGALAGMCGRAAACSLSRLVTGMLNPNNTSYTDTRWSTLGRWHVFSAQARARVFPPNDLLFSFSQQN